MDIGGYLKNLREQKDLSMRQVMIRSKGLLDKTTISRIEKNKRRLSMRAAYAFSKIYGTPLDDIAEREIGISLGESPPPLVVSSLEKLLLERFRQLSRSRKLLVLDIVTGLSLLATRDDDPRRALEQALGQEREEPKQKREK